MFIACQIPFRLGLPSAVRGARYGTVWLLAGVGTSMQAAMHITIVQFRQECFKRIELRSAVREFIEEPVRTTVKSIRWKFYRQLNSMSIPATHPTGTSHLDLDRREKSQIGSDSESNVLNKADARGHRKDEERGNAP